MSNQSPSLDPPRVPVRGLIDGSIEVGNPPVGAAGTGLVATVGGIVAVDPVNHTSPYILVPGEPDEECLWGLRETLGDEVARAVAAVASGRVDGYHSVVYAVSPEWELVRHLGHLTWLAQYGAVDLAHPLITVERLTLSSQVASLLEPEWPAVADLVLWTDTIVEWAQRARSYHSPWPRHPTIAGLLMDALGALAEHVPATDQRLESVLHELDLAAAIVTMDLAHVDLEARPAWLQDVQPQPAHALGGPADQILNGTAAVDWLRVPFGSTVRSEGGVDWRIRPQDGGHVFTVVVKTPRSTPDFAVLATATIPLPRLPMLYATVYQGESRLPLVVADLTLRPETASWVGFQRVARPVVDRLGDPCGGAVEVDIHVQGASPPRRDRASQNRASARRWAARGLTALRLSSVAEGAARDTWRSTSQQALVQAAKGYAGVGDPEADLAAAQCRSMSDGLGGSAAPTRQFWREGPRLPIDTAAIVAPQHISAAEVWFALGSQQQ